MKTMVVNTVRDLIRNGGRIPVSRTRFTSGLLDIWPGSSEAEHAPVKRDVEIS